MYAETIKQTQFFPAVESSHMVLLYIFPGY